MEINLNDGAADADALARDADEDDDGDVSICSDSLAALSPSPEVICNFGGIDDVCCGFWVELVAGAVVIGVVVVPVVVDDDVTFEVFIVLATGSLDSLRAELGI